MNKNNMLILIILSLVCLTASISFISANENVTEDNILNERDNILSLENNDQLNSDNYTEPIKKEIENESILSSNSEEILGMDNNTETLEATDNGYITGVTAKWGATKYIYLGWNGYFSGTFKVYKGNTCVHNEILNGYTDDRQWSTSGLSVGTYTAKLINSNGKIIDTSTITIQKSAVKISVKSFTANAGTTFYCYAYVIDKYDNSNYNGGYVYFKINGKNYKAKLNHGVSILKFKIPSKAKTYTCKATYKGNSQFQGATKTFKMTVKKIKYKILTKKIKYKWSTAKVGKYKIKYRLWRVIYYGGYYNDVDIILYKNGKQLPCSKYLTTYHTKFNGKWKWMKWRHGGVNHAYHRYATIYKVDKIKIKFRI